MRTRLAWTGLLAVLAVGCAGEFESATTPQMESLALVSVRPSTPASLAQSRPADCPWCTNAFGAEFTVAAPQTLPVVNLWLDGWSGSRRCLYSQHDSPVDGFTLVAGQPATVTFRQASVECSAPFTIDRIEARVRSGDTLVYQGSWPVSLSFVE